MAFDARGLEDYVDVAARIAEFREKYPDGTLQPADLSRPFWVEAVGDQTFVVYVAAAYRCSDDIRPGVGAAWEPFPGRTPYTRGSELMNAETSAWGRAIVAALAADTKRIASREEVRNRAAEREEPAAAVPEELEGEPGSITREQYRAMDAAFAEIGAKDRQQRLGLVFQILGREVATSSSLSYREAQQVLSELHHRAAAPKDAA